MLKKRKLEIAVISDIYLGSYDCHAEELLIYLNSIQPKKLILNGGIVDIWQFGTGYFPISHTMVLKKILTMASKGTEVCYITGNHDDNFRTFSDVSLGQIRILNKLILEIDGKRVCFFHGDVFDFSAKISKSMLKFGQVGFDFLLKFNRLANHFLIRIGKKRYSLSRKIKENPQKSIKQICDFENAAAELAIENGYDHIICGHTHRPKKEIKATKKGQCTYLNSGDWVENLTALEYSLKRWKVYAYNHDKLAPFFADEDMKEMDIHELVASINKKKARREGESLQD